MLPENAALNILVKGIESGRDGIKFKYGVGHTETLNAWGENSPCLSLETGLNKLTVFLTIIAFSAEAEVVALNY